MADAQSLLDQTLNEISPVPSVSDTKRAQVSQAAEEKRNALGPVPTQEDLYRMSVVEGTSKGAETMSEIEKDLRTLDPLGLLVKYGSEATELIRRKAAANRRVYNAESATRSSGEAAWDLGSGVVAGAANSVAGIGNLAVGAFSDEYGTAIAQGIAGANKWLHSTQSSALNQARELQAAKSAMTSRDNLARYEEEIARGDGSFAGMRRWGRDFVDALGNISEDGYTLSQGGAEAVGSLLAGGAVTKGLKTVGTAVTGGRLTNPGVRAAAEMSRGLGVPSAARAADAAGRAGSWSAWPLTIAAMEAGGVYQATANRVMETPVSKLEETSAEFRSIKTALLEDGLDEATANEQARIGLAGLTARDAAATQAPIAAAASLISRGLGEAPMKARSVGGTLKGMGQEALEEGSQSATGKLFENFAFQNNVDPNQTLSEGVGEATAQGTIYGTMAAGAVQAPGTVANVTVGAGRLGIAGAKAAGNAVLKRGENALDRAASESASATIRELPARSVELSSRPVEVVNQEVQDTVQAVRESGGSEQEATEIGDYTTKLDQTLRFNPAEVDSPSLPPSIREAINRTDRTEALLEVAAAIATAATPAEQIMGALVLEEILSPVNQVMEATPRGLDNLDPDSPVLQRINTYLSVAQNLGSVPEIAKAREAAKKVLEDREAVRASVPPVTEEMLGTPEGDTAVRNTVTLARSNPLSLDPGQVETLRQHSSDGRINLTPEQMQTLDIAMSLIQAEKDFLESKKSNPNSAAQNVVSENIFTAARVGGRNPEDRGKDSALEHTRKVRDAAMAGNTEQAKTLLNEFGMFVQHMKNKVEALNTFYAKGDPKGAKVPYLALNPDKLAMYLTSPDKGVFINWAGQRAVESVDMAQSIAKEQKALADIYNTLVRAFPDLGESQIEPVALPDIFNGDAREVVKRLRGKSSVPAVPTVAPVTPAAGNTSTPPSVPPGSNNQANTGNQEDGDQGEGKPPSSGSNDGAKPLNVWHGTGENAEFSNLALRPFTYQGKRYHSVEHAYQTWKSGEFDQVTYDKYTGKPGEKFRGKPARTENKWNIRLMGVLMQRSFEQNPDALAALKATGDAVITHDQDTGIWKETFPQILMNIRKHVKPKKAAAAAEASTPPQAAETTTEAAASSTGQNNNLNQENQSETGTPTPPTAPVTSTPAPQTNVEGNRKGESKGIRALYPNLLRSVRNMFASVFHLLDEPLNNIVGLENPVQTVLEYLRDTASYVAASTMSSSGLTQEALAHYRKLLAHGEGVKAEGNLQQILEIMDKNLRDKLNEATSNKQTFAERLLAGDNVHMWRDGKVFNILDEVDGDLSYNPVLKDLAALAGIQAMLTMNDRIYKLDDEDLAAITGIRLDDVYRLSPRSRTVLENSVNESDVLKQISSLITRFWGVKARDDQPTGFTEGIPNAVAGEVLRALVEANMIEQETVTLTEADGLPEFDNNGKRYKNGEKVLVRYAAVRGTYDPNTQAITNDPHAIVAAFSTVIEDVITKASERPFYIEDAKVPEAQTQMNNPSVSLSDVQKRVVKSVQQIPYRIDNSMVKLYQALGEKGHLTLFGLDGLENRPLNIKDRESLEGQRLNLLSSLRTFNNLMEQIEGTAEATGKARNEVAVRYAFNFSKVGRLQMLGSYTPQNSKGLREVILPTWTTIDLTGKDNEAFLLSIAQGLGLKVHVDGTEVSTKLIQEKLDGELKPLVTLMQDFLRAESGLIDANEIKQGFDDAGLGMSYLALHVLTEYARFKNTDANELKAFETSVYVEADGVTNGMIMAMLLSTPGAFTPTMIRNIMKGGISFGSKMTLSDLRKLDPDDLYTDGAIRGSEHVHNQQQGMLDHSPVAAQAARPMYDLMSLLLKDLGVVWDDNTLVLDIKRAVTKNPMTIITYGSSENGIAGNLVDAMTKKIYQTFSEHLAKHKAGSVTEADKAELKHLVDLYNAMTSTKIIFDEATETYKTADVNSTTKSKSFEEFVVPKQDYETLQHNVLELFVKPMVRGFNETMGQSLMDNLNTIKKATQVQSIVVEHLFNQMLKETAQNNKASSAKRQKETGLAESNILGDHVTQNDVKKIEKELAERSPHLAQGGQILRVLKNQMLPSIYDTAANLVDTMRSSADYRSPKDVGVGGIPSTNIGFGDGMTIVQYALNKLTERYLPIFDGINIPLDQLQLQGTAANEATYKAMMGNPTRAVQESYEVFLQKNLAWVEQNLVADQNVSGRPFRNALARSLFEDPRQRKSVSNAEIIDAIRNLSGDLKINAASIDSNHAAMAAMPMSVDQMAAIGAPFTNQTMDPNAQVLSPEEAAEQLNKLREKFQSERRGSNQGARSKPAGKPASKAPTHSGSGAQILTPNMLKARINSASLLNGQKVILNALVQSGVLKDAKVIMGSLEQIIAYRQSQGITDHSSLIPKDGETIHGAMSVDRGEVYLINPSEDTLLHELIHLATSNVILGYYRGLQGNGPRAAEAVKAIKRLESLMAEFLTMSLPVNMPHRAQFAYEQAKREIEAAKAQGTPEGKAKALDEFMAWTLANQDLVTHLQKTESPLKALARNVIEAIRQLIWGRQSSIAVTDSFFSDIRFNAVVVIATRDSLPKAITEATYRHASQGMPERLVHLRKALADKVGSLINTTRYRTNIEFMAKIGTAGTNAREVTQAFGAHFDMTDPEYYTFEMIVTALGTQIELDPAAMARMQEIYDHVSAQLTVEHFEDPTIIDDQSRRYLGQQKFNLFTGRTIERADKEGRSTLLPSFLALAMVNEPFRQVLATLPVPEMIKNEANTLDAWFENQGHAAFDWLHKNLSGEKKSHNVQVAMDRLAARITDTSMREQSLLAQAEGAVSGVMNNVNQRITRGMTKLAESAETLNIKTQRESNSRMRKASTAIAETVSKVASEDHADSVALGFMNTMNKAKLPKPLFDLLNDLIGRTSENAPIYDMIKIVRATVQQMRQNYRKKVPKIIEKKFTRTLRPEEWAALHVGMFKMDLAVLTNHQGRDDVLALLTNRRAFNERVTNLETQLQAADPLGASLYMKKAKELAIYMRTGEAEGNLLRNAHAIGHLLLEKKPAGWVRPSASTISLIDQLTTLYAYKELPAEQRRVISSLVQEQGAGVDFMLAYLAGLRKDEMDKTLQGRSLFNHYKGYAPEVSQNGMSLKIAYDSEARKLIAQGYVRVADYKGSSSDFKRSSMGYYLSPVTSQAAFLQGNFQNIQQTASGVDKLTGYTSGLMAGRVTQTNFVQHLVRRASRAQKSQEALLPVFNEDGDVVAYERDISRHEVARTKPSQNIHEMLGVWRGRQEEENLASQVNTLLIERLHKVWRDDIRRGTSNQDAYVDAFASTNPIIKDAVSLLSAESVEEIKNTFGDKFWVRNDMIDDVFGFRMPSVRDFFNEKSPLSGEFQKTVQDVLVGLFGAKTFKILVQGEQVVQGTMTALRQRIVVQSMIVPALNIISNIGQLAVNGVPYTTMVKDIPKKVSEIESYAKSFYQQIELEAEILATSSPQRKSLLEARVQAIKDSHKRLSIWPLIKAGEFSTVADVGMTAEDLELTSGNVEGYIKQQIDKLPPYLQTAAHYGLMTPHTSLFTALQKSVQYGDFIAKAMLYEQLTRKEKMSEEAALAYVSEAFVNYDRLPGRMRAGLESMGLFWFGNYKIRSVKEAVRMLRRRPLQSLLFMNAPLPSEIGSPLGDNFFSKLWNGTLGYSIGPGMAWQGVALNPWVSLAR